jgi:hypothetical protein
LKQTQTQIPASSENTNYLLAYIVCSLKDGNKIININPQEVPGAQLLSRILNPTLINSLKSHEF